MRRNESAAAALQSLGAGKAEGSGGGAGERCGGRLPKNKSFAVLHQLRNHSDELVESEELVEVDNARLRAGFTALTDLSRDLRMPAPAASSLDNWRPDALGAFEEE